MALLKCGSEVLKLLIEKLILAHIFYWGYTNHCTFGSRKVVGIGEWQIIKFGFMK